MRKIRKNFICKKSVNLGEMFKAEVRNHFFPGQIQDQEPHQNKTILDIQ